MRNRIVATAWIGSIVWVGLSPAAEPTSLPAGRAPVPVQTIASKDLPTSRPVPEWNAKWNSPLAGVTDLLSLGKSLYVLSTANGYYLQFGRDLQTGKLQLREAIEMHRHSKGSTWGALAARTLADGQTVLYATYGTEGDGPKEGSLRWFRVDATTGSLTQAGVMEASWPFQATPGPYGYAAMVWSPDRTRFYKAFVQNITWVTFRQDGTPETGGSVAMRNRSDARGRPHPSGIISADGKQLYLLVERAQPVDGATWLLDQYDVDAATGVPAFAASLPVPDAEGWVQFLDFAPDGRHVYVMTGNASGQVVMTLARDAAKGRLSIVARQDDARFKGLGGAPWERGMLRFNADGRSGYFTTRGWAKASWLWTFTRDPATGELTIHGSIDGTGRIFDLDATHGILVWGNDPIRVYRTPAAK